MAARELRRITDHVTCPVCLQTYNIPKMLPCQHTYCQQCLHNIEKDKTVTCPECRKVTDVPPGGVQDFPTNLTINHLIDDFFLRRQDRRKVNCETCVEEDPVTSFCFTCSVFMCQTCQAFHNRSKVTHQHVIVYLEKPASQPNTAQPQKVLPNCPDHDLELKFYCVPCGRLVCVYCTMNEHVEHSHGAIKTMATKYREQLKNTTAPLNDMITNLSQAHSDIADTKEKVLRQHKSVDKDIDQFFDNVIQKVEQQRKQLKQELHNKVGGMVQLLTSQLEEVGSVQAHVMSVNELASKVEKSCDEEMLSGNTQLMDRINDVTNIFNNTCLIPKEIDSCRFVPNDFMLPQFGHVYSNEYPPLCEITDIPPSMLQDQAIQFTIIAKDFKGIPLLIGGSTVKVQLDNRRGSIQSVTVKDNKNGRYTGSFNTKLVGHHQLSVTIGGQNIKETPLSFFVSRDYCKLSGSESRMVVSDRGKLGRPWGIAFNESNHHWAVTDSSNHCVYIFNEQDQLVRKFGSHGEGPGQFNGPRGIAFDEDNFLYVVDSFNNRAQKLDLTGKFFIHFKGRWLSKQQLNEPIGIVVHHNKVYIADCCNHRISVFQTDGTYCFSFGSRGSGPGQFRYPWDVVITPGNTLLVADGAGHCIQSFQLDGTFIHKFGNHSKGKLNFPTSVAVDPDGFILVSQRGNHQVSIFDIGYNYLNSFGSKGSGRNQYNTPRGIAVDYNGVIYISDTDNNRIIMK
ncbi:E3 ubiquitin-protein ligase TRIM71-like [Dysidea avara]|uniref:E3 ubiquitin-protein ligase TRIM71-like n=1 Tax=Dysidea avara TaxID=196820 RepID=UPI00332A5230